MAKHLDVSREDHRAAYSLPTACFPPTRPSAGRSPTDCFSAMRSGTDCLPDYKVLVLTIDEEVIAARLQEQVPAPNWRSLRLACGSRWKIV